MDHCVWEISFKHVHVQGIQWWMALIYKYGDQPLEQFHTFCCISFCKKVLNTPRHNITALLLKVELCNHHKPTI